MRELLKNALAQFQGELLWDTSLAAYTYYKVGGSAHLIATPISLSDLSILQNALKDSLLPYYILGQASNVLISDEGFPGIIIRTTKLNTEIAEQDQSIVVGGSVPLASLIRQASQKGWAGLEFLAGIPGSIGGAIRMNAGTRLGEVKDSLQEVKVFCLSQTDELVTYTKDTFRFEYRKNLFLPKDGVVWQGTFGIEKKDPKEVARYLKEILSDRKKVQPLEYPSCGSVFKNPKSFGLSAWQVIEKLGLKGFRLGDAQFSEKHANFIINLGSAKAHDIRNLILTAKKRAKEELGIDLEEEVIFISGN